MIDFPEMKTYQQKQKQKTLTELTLSLSIYLPYNQPLNHFLSKLSRSRLTV